MRDLVRLVEGATGSNQHRAEAMGFDTSRVWYHGATGVAIDAFDSRRRGQNTFADSAKLGFFFASSPEVAGSYGRHEDYRSDQDQERYDQCAARIEEIEAAHFSKIKPEKYDNRSWSQEKAALEREMHALPTMVYHRAVVHPVYLKLLKPLLHDMHGRKYRDISYADLIQNARKSRRDGVIIRNTFDPGHDPELQVHNHKQGIANPDIPMCDIAVVFKPQQIRSIFAHFDPDKADSSAISD